MAFVITGDAATNRTNLGLGTAATLDVGTSANNIVQLDGSGNLPAIDGSALTGVSAGKVLKAQFENGSGTLTTTSTSWTATGISKSFTPTSSTSTLICTFMATGGNNGANARSYLRFNFNGTGSSKVKTHEITGANSVESHWSIMDTFQPGSTSPVTVALDWWAQSGTTGYLNTNSSWTMLILEVEI
jgi:hypothetical protein